MFSGNLSLRNQRHLAHRISSSSDCACLASTIMRGNACREPCFTAPARVSRRRTWGKKEIVRSTYILLTNRLARSEKGAKSIKGQDQRLASGHWNDEVLFNSISLIPRMLVRYLQYRVFYSTLSPYLTEYMSLGLLYFLTLPYLTLPYFRVTLHTPPHTFSYSLATRSFPFRTFQIFQAATHPPQNSFFTFHKFFHNSANGPTKFSAAAENLK